MKRSTISSKLLLVADRRSGARDDSPVRRYRLARLPAGTGRPAVRALTGEPVRH